ncbi:protein kinase domain-containing protein [Streptomyces spirodelae]|uniref:Protein kinase n=1 Tax=Streptomyces spirodelae TaxID=2812904 RepID=A0ABS3X3W2_9ACTN|nr:protein kinase [Streptomyces spirodelae]MBO8189999.1 protein kinase [Streptomyces spirodelae]
MIEGIARLRETDPRRLGPFRLFGVLGHGGAGTVYLGKGTPRRGARKRAVAVRAVRPELLRDRQLRARLRQETARVADAVDSPFVAHAFGCELDSEHPWIAEAFVPGVSLSALVARYGPLPEMSVRALGGALARALATLDAAGTAHGDLRASNVLLTADGPRLVDYGIALGRRSAAVGAAGFGPSARRAEDVFALGTVLALAASARHPFEDSALPSAREGPDLAAVPDSLCVPLLACLHKAPETRPHPESLAHTLDISGTANRPAREWLPEPYLHEIGSRADEARALAGRWGWGH